MDSKSMQDTKSSDSNSLKEQIVTMRKSLFLEEIVNEQFTTLEMMEDDENPNFVDTIVSSYLCETRNDIYAIEQALNATPPDQAKVYQCLHKLKGRNSSIGANKVNIEIIKMQDCSKGGDMDGCKAGFPSLKQEFDTLKNKMEEYLKLLRQDESAATGRAQWRCGLQE